MKKIAITIENSFVLLVAEDVTIYVYTRPNTSVLLLSWKILEDEEIVVGCGSIKSKCFHRQ